MAFWTDSSIEPKRNYGFIVTFGNEELQGMSFAVKSCTKPKMTQTEVSWAYLNYNFYFPGRVEHDVITMVTANLSLDDDSAYAVASLLQKSGYVIPGDRNSLVTIGKRKAIDALGAMVVKQVDTEGNTLETWRFKNAWLKDVSFSDGDYTDDELSTVEMVFRYDFVELDVPSRGTLFVPRSSQSERARSPESI